MFRNYLAAALRHLARNRLYAAINIIGLAVGFAAALLIGLFVRDELTYDRWIPGHENIYRVSTYTFTAGLKQPFDIAPLGAAEPMRQEFPEIEALTQFSCCGETVSLRRGDVEAMEGIHWAEPNIFDLLPLPVIAGDLHTALTTPNGIVITRTLAQKYFGKDAPIGETVELGRKTLVHVTAVLEDLPSNTHLDFAIIAPSNAPNSAVDRTDIKDEMYTYIRLTSEAAAKHVREGLAAFNERHPELTTGRRSYWLSELSPITDIHLRPNTTSSMKPSANARTAYSVMAIAILIVTVASINFVNLTTARAMRRAVEVGVRKVSGALRWQFIIQFIGESVFYAALGMAAAIAVAKLLLPAFNAFLQRTIMLDIWTDPVVPIALVTVVALVGIAAGAYPALVLSRFTPASVLKGALQVRKTRSKTRQALVAAQFAVLIVLTLVSVTITRQVRHISTDALRLDTDQTLVINGGIIGACAPAFVTAVRDLAGVRGATCVTGPILGGPVLLMDVEAPAGTKAKSQFLPVDFGSLEMYGLRPLAGRFFSPDHGGDSPPLDGKIDLGTAVVINESLARGLGFSRPQDALGQIVRFSPTIARTAAEKRPNAVTEIIGVVPDFGASRDLRETAPARVFFIEPDFTQGHGSVHVKLAGSHIPETLSQIDALWKHLGPPKPIERTFLDQTIEGMYREFARQGEITGVFAAIAVFISCLGLFGLAAFAAEQRTKEIGVRKSMGASGADIVRLMLWDFSKPVLWGSLIAWPVAYLIMQRWLENFAERIDVGLWMFPLASLLALGIALLTVIGHALLVARAEPVKALRYE